MSGEPLFRWDWLFAHIGPILDRVGQHLYVTVIAVSVGFAISFALAVVSIRRRRLYPFVTLLSTALYTIPSFAMFSALVVVTGLSLLTAEIPLITTRSSCSCRTSLPASTPCRRTSSTRPTAWATRRRSGGGTWSCRSPSAGGGGSPSGDRLHDRPGDGVGHTRRSLRRTGLLHPGRLRAPFPDGDPARRAALRSRLRSLASMGFVLLQRLLTGLGGGFGSESLGSSLMDIVTATAQLAGRPGPLAGPEQGSLSAWREHVALSGVRPSCWRPW